MQHSTSQHDDLARVPGTQTGAGCRRRTIASRDRRHPPARRSCRVVDGCWSGSVRQSCRLSAASRARRPTDQAPKAGLALLAGEDADPGEFSRAGGRCDFNGGLANHLHWERITSCPCSKSPQGRERLVIFSGQPYRHGHVGDSLGRCFDLGFPLSQPSRARTQVCRPSASVGRPSPTTPRSTSALTPGSTSMGVALPDLASSHRRDGAGQARDRRRVAS